MGIYIKLLEPSDEQQLFNFECENKDYFSQVGFPRENSYYDRDNFRAIIRALVEEQQQGNVYMYTVTDDSGVVVGRVNLISVIRGSLNKAELGYRIAEKWQGKGIATTAVKLVLDEALKNLKLHRIEAGTSPDNIGSQIVLIKNGFEFIGRNHKYIFQNGKWYDSINFEKILD